MIIIFRLKLIRWQFIGRLKGREDTSDAAALLFNWDVVAIVVKQTLMTAKEAENFLNLVDAVSDGICKHLHAPNSFLWRWLHNSSEKEKNSK